MENYIGKKLNKHYLKTCFFLGRWHDYYFFSLKIICHYIWHPDVSWHNIYDWRCKLFESSSSTPPWRGRWRIFAVKFADYKLDKVCGEKLAHPSITDEGVIIKKKTLPHYLIPWEIFIRCVGISILYLFPHSHPHITSYVRPSTPAARLAFTFFGLEFWSSGYPLIINLVLVLW